ncbi:transcriptional regulator, ArsR family [Chlorobium phaeobacteroides DSM 266]|uniref:Transcriptional regulator, ArsR family n=2 Tax=Chlorobium phaeobacteroides TaxID=1096 RepID=A1BGI6_CHLPD|nr:transcriptional regulator, ArsR family [Chlorobium phaeobacteroides DSM 266]
MRERTTEIRNYMLTACRDRSLNVAAETARHFKISRQAASRHLHALEEAGLVRSEGAKNVKKSTLIPLKQTSWTFLLAGLKEDVVWLESIAPLIADLPGNVREMWQYGATEMINNALDHSEGLNLSIYFSRNAIDCELTITDDGEGIFHRIQRLTGLYDARESILELAKGKLTTDPQNHSGEGIFFTSRAFDSFVIISRNLYFTHRAEKDDWLIDIDSDTPGTSIYLRLSNTCPRTMKEIYDEYAEPDEYAFNKTRVPVKLARYEEEKLVSRSQAKRLVSRFEKFSTVILDFEDVEEIGQAFADEIFRVFASNHPEVKLITAHATDAVNKMILRALAVR